MSEPLTTTGQSDHGPPDPLDPPGLCPRCRKECRDFTEVDGISFCDKCGEIVSDLRAIFTDYKQCLGTGEP
jgi:hypothetical protein